MIFDKPKNWRDLQDKVCTILNQVGFEATTGKIIKTPRGEVEIDVFAIDPFSIDKIVYIIECKSWKSRVPQTVIHSFNTVMQETGTNVGYIISEEGFQKGAYNYIENTSIKNFTFVQFQQKYLKAWAGRYFYDEIDKITNSLFHYTEFINSRRERYIDALSQTEQISIRLLMEKYLPLTLLFINIAQTSRILSNSGENPLSEVPDLIDINDLKQKLHKFSGYIFTATCYTDLLSELKPVIDNITNQFNVFFGKDIFKD